MEKERVNIGITGIQIDARNYAEEFTDVSIHLKVTTEPFNLLKVLDDLHEDIEKLLDEKYRVYHK